MPSTDAELIAQFKNGDPSAFDTLVLRYQPQIMALVSHIMHSPDQVEDIAQDVFLRAYRGLARFRGDSSFATWITRIAVNMCASELRRRKIRETFRLPAQDTASEPQPLRKLQKAEERLWVQEALDRLSSRHRIVAALFYIEELSCEEISQIVGCSRGTVKSRLFHARKRLRRLLLPYYRDAEPLFQALDERDRP